MTTRVILTMIVLCCGFWAFMIHQNVQSRDVTENSSRFRFPPQREGLLLRLHRNRVNAAVVEGAGKMWMRATRADLRADQRTPEESVKASDPDTKGPRNVNRSHMLPSAHRLSRDAQVGKAQRSRKSDPRDFSFFSKGRSGTSLAKLQKGLREASTETVDSNPERLSRKRSGVDST